MFENQKGFFRLLIISACFREKTLRYAPKGVEKYFLEWGDFSFEKVQRQTLPLIPPGREGMATRAKQSPRQRPFPAGRGAPTGWGGGELNTLLFPYQHPTNSYRGRS